MRRFTFYYILILIILITNIHAQDSLKFASHLQNQIGQKGTEETYSVWIFFKDKGPNIENRLIDIQAKLTPRALKRRMKNRKNKSLVDFYDVPIYYYYIQQIRNEVQSINHKSRWLNAVAVEIEGKKLEKIANFDFVKKIEIVHKWKMPKVGLEHKKQDAKTFQSVYDYSFNFDYGPSFTQMNIINVPEVHALGFDGSGVLIAMLDSGFDNLDHEAMNHLNILHTWDFVNSDSIVGDEPNQMGSAEHGTFTLSLIGGFQSGELIGPAYNADYLLAKTENTEWERHIEEDDWIAGAEWADSLGADIISSSLGYFDDFTHGDTDYTWLDMDGNTTIVTIGADIAAGRGILVVNSAGNYFDPPPPHNTLIGPADGDSVLAVGGVDSSGIRVSYSSIGPTIDGRIKPDVMAMANDGYTIESDGPGYVYINIGGTSASCPQVAGVGALVLQANPNLTNMEILELLRNTASRATNPDNAYGYGIVDAFKAVMYFRPYISHEPHSDTENLNGPYYINAEISGNFPILSDSIKTHYRVDGGQWISIPMIDLGGGNYQAQITGPGSAAMIEYYIKAVNTMDAVTSPFLAPQEVYKFYIGPDVTPPIIVHTPIEELYYIEWPSVIQANITDNIGVDNNNVFVEWTLNNNLMKNFNLTYIEPNLFIGTFDTCQVSVDDIVHYRIAAYDTAQLPNVAYSPDSEFYELNITQPKALILILNDSPPDTEKTNYDQSTNNLFFVNRYKSWLESRDYYVKIENPDSSLFSTWENYDFLFSVSGMNSDPLNNPLYRQQLIHYMQNGGKLLIEGGEVGFAMFSTDSIFTAEVLHSVDWIGDFAGPLRKISAYNDHILLNYPSILPFQITLNNEKKYVHDSMVPDNQSYVVYNGSSSPGNTGILVYDLPTSPQIVYFAFDLASVSDSLNARQFLENAAAYLTEEQTSISEEKPIISTNVILYPAYPNPFNPETTIKFFLPKASKVQLEIFNLLGQRIETLLDKPRLDQGLKTVKWNAQNRSSGVYYFLLKTEQKTKVQKILLIK